MDYFSEFAQDRFLFEHFFCGKRGGVFVDIGAHDGRTHSNTFFFERTMGWSGLCVEADAAIFPDLKATRQAICEQVCLAKLDNATDPMGASRKTPTAALSSLLEKHSLIEIDYCSIGGGGDVRSILSGFDPERFRISVFTITNEHQDQRIRDLISHKGYELFATLQRDDVFIRLGMRVIPPDPIGHEKAMLALSQGLTLLSQGQPHEAARAFGEALEELPANSDALHLLGLTEAQMGHFEKAAALITQSIAVNPKNADALCNYAATLRSLKRVDESLVYYDRALAIRPDHIRALADRDSALLETRKAKSVTPSAVYDRTIAPTWSSDTHAVNAHEPTPATSAQSQSVSDELAEMRRRLKDGRSSFGKGSNHPSVLDAEFAAAQEHHRQGRLEHAAAAYNSILAREPDHYKALHFLGQLLLKQGQCKQAERHLARSIRIHDKDALAFGAHGGALMQLGRLEEALASFDRAVALKPDYAEAFSDRGAVLASLGRLDEALASYDRAVALKPDYAPAFFNMGKTLHDFGRLDEALARHERAVALVPDYREAINSCGVILHELGRMEEAITCFDRVIALEPDFAEAYLNRGLCNLAIGRSARGWPDFEYRWKQKDYRSERPLLNAPHWLGERLNGRAILVYDEEGLGDTIQFARYLEDLTKQGAKVSLLLRSKLADLLASLAGNIRILTRVPAEARFDFQTPLLSLPLRLGVDLAHMKTNMPYISADPERSARWAARLESPGFKVGICWQGSPKARIDAGRSIPLRAFAPLSRISGVRLISLQKNYGRDQLLSLPPAMQVETLGEDFDADTHAFADSAAVMEHLDLIVTSDTSVAHLAGALGRPTWLALKHAADWRWMRDRSDSPWYPTMRLFRQKKAGDWATVFEEMAAELATLHASTDSQRSGLLSGIYGWWSKPKQAR